MGRWNKMLTAVACMGLCGTTMVGAQEGLPAEVEMAYYTNDGALQPLKTFVKGTMRLPVYLGLRASSDEEGRVAFDEIKTLFEIPMEGAGIALLKGDEGDNFFENINEVNKVQREARYATRELFESVFEEGFSKIGNEVFFEEEGEEATQESDEAKEELLLSKAKSFVQSKEKDLKKEGVEILDVSVEDSSVNLTFKWDKFQFENFRYAPDFEGEVEISVDQNSAYIYRPTLRFDGRHELEAIGHCGWYIKSPHSQAIAQTWSSLGENFNSGRSLWKVRVVGDYSLLAFDEKTLNRMTRAVKGGSSLRTSPKFRYHYDRLGYTPDFGLFIDGGSLWDIFLKEVQGELGSDFDFPLHLETIGSFGYMNETEVVGEASLKIKGLERFTEGLEGGTSDANLLKSVPWTISNLIWVRSEPVMTVLGNLDRFLEESYPESSMPLGALATGMVGGMFSSELAKEIKEGNVDLLAQYRQFDFMTLGGLGASGKTSKSILGSAGLAPLTFIAHSPGMNYPKVATELRETLAGFEEHSGMSWSPSGVISNLWTAEEELLGVGYNRNMVGLSLGYSIGYLDRNLSVPENASLSAMGRFARVSKMIPENETMVAYSYRKLDGWMKIVEGFGLELGGQELREGLEQLLDFKDASTALTLEGQDIRAYYVFSRK